MASMHALSLLLAVAPVPFTQASGPSSAPELCLWYTAPAARWTEALPVGNGRLGAMVFGGVGGERLQLNEDSLWAGAPIPRDRRGAREHLAEVRRLLVAGEVQAGQALAQRTLMGPEKHVSYETLGDLWFDVQHAGEAEGYRRCLDLASAIATVRYRVGTTTFTREVFASAVDDVIVVRFGVDRPGALDLDVRWTRPGDAARVEASGPDPEHGVFALGLTGRAAADEGQGGARFAGRAWLRADGSGAAVSCDGERLQVRGADGLTVFVAARTDLYGGDADPPAELARAAQHLARADSAALRERHVRDHAALFARVTLDLGGDPGAALLPTDERLAAVRAGASDPGLAALYTQYGRYLLLGASRPGTAPANLQGLWSEHLVAPWNADYHININLQMNYWPAEVLNLAECHAPLFDLVDRLRPNGAVTAREVYGARGWVAHHTTDAHGFTAPIGNTVWGLWPFGGAWLTRHHYEHFVYGGDLEFARTRAFPALAGAARFFLDYLVPHPVTGELVSGPSSSPENTYILPDGQRADVAMGNTMDHMIVRDLFLNVLEVAAALGIDEREGGEDGALVAAVRSALPRLAPTRIGPDGRVLEWAEPHAEAEPGHRHMSHLFGLHPGREITPEHTPELAAAARRSIDARLASGGGHTGWSRAWLIQFMARLGDGDAAHRHLTLLLAKSTLPNLFDDHPPFQIDGNFGGAAGVAEMLVQSHAGTVHILPALPSAWPRGRATGLRARGGFEIDVTWDPQNGPHGEVHATRGGPLRLRIGTGEVRSFNTQPGERVAF